MGSYPKTGIIKTPSTKKRALRPDASGVQRMQGEIPDPVVKARIRLLRTKASEFNILAEQLVKFVESPKWDEYDQRITEAVKRIAMAPFNWIKIAEGLYATPPEWGETPELVHEDCSDGKCLLKNTLELSKEDHCGFCETVASPPLLSEAIGAGLSMAELQTCRDNWESDPNRANIPWRV